MKPVVSFSIGTLQGLYGPCGALDWAKEVGVDTVDFDLTRYNHGKEGNEYNTDDENAVREYFTAIRKYADEIGMKIGQTHGRIRAYRKDDEEHNYHEKMSGRWDMLATSILGAKYCVVHSVHLGLDAADDDQRAFNKRMFDDLLPFAKQYGVIIANETLGTTSTDDGRVGLDFFAEIGEFERFNRLYQNNEYKDNLCVCLDTGHTHRCTPYEGQLSVADYIKRVGSQIKCLHINDNDGIDDLHLPPMTGTINWEATLKALKEIDYQGTFNMEVILYKYGKVDELMKAYAKFSVELMKRAIDCYWK